MLKLAPVSLGVFYYGHIRITQTYAELQKKAIRIFTSSKCIAHANPLFPKLKLLNLDDLYKHHLGMFKHKATNKQLPISMSAMFLRNDDVHKLNLRNQYTYYIQQIGKHV